MELMNKAAYIIRKRATLNSYNIIGVVFALLKGSSDMETT